MRAAIPEHIHLRGGFDPQEGMFFGLHPQMRSGDAGIYEKPAHIVKQIHITFEQSCRGCSLPVDVERSIVLEHGVRSHERETVYVKVHQGVDDGEIIVIKGRGNATAWMQSDIRVVVTISNETAFQRRGLDLLFVKSITLREALCGVSFEIKHPSGRALGISTIGRVVGPAFEKRVSGFGVIRIDPGGNTTETGDLLLTFAIQFPASLETATVEALEGLLS
jgi:DnaJ-class molecular chaperone